MKSFILSSALGAVAIATIFACSHRTIEFERSSDGGSSPPTFTEGDAASANDATMLISYCPATSCTGNTTTCPTSRFPCDVDLRTDKENCGACGVRCPGLSACTNGACAIDSCSGRFRDCNGSIEDGCETRVGTNDNCGDCGDVCTDPTRPCISLGNDTYQCGCPSGQTVCGGLCYDLSANDRNCAACGEACDPTGGGAPSYPNVYYGCIAGQCGNAKCAQGFADCNKDLADGCETEMGTVENCGGCGIACEPGQVCGSEKGQAVCQCGAGLKLCGSHCRDLQVDPWNCGACGVVCMESYAGTSQVIGQCIYGSCVYECAVGWGDCNGDPSDSCETNLRSDPTNCGGCGIHCAKDQPCIGGRCAVEPCPDGGTGLQ